MNESFCGETFFEVWYLVYVFTGAALYGHNVNMVDCAAGDKGTKKVATATALCVRQTASHKRALSRGERAGNSE